MLDLLTYLMTDCPAVAAVDGQAALAYMREKLAKNPPASLFYTQDGPAVRLSGGESLVILSKEAVPTPARPIASLTEPAQGRSPEKSQTLSRRPVVPIIRPPEK